MVQENELVTLLLGIGTIIFVLAFLPRLRQLPKYRWLLLAVAGQSGAWVFTILETWYYPTLFNGIEHFGYMICSLSLLIWIILSAQYSGEKK